MVMQVLVSNWLTGKGETVVVRVEASDTIYSLMSQLEDMLGIPPILQRLTVNGKPVLHDSPGTLAENGVVKKLCWMPAMFSFAGWNVLAKKTLLRMGLAVDRGGAFDAAERRLWMEGRRPPLGPPPAAGKMRFYVRDFVVPGPGKTLTLEADAGETVAGIASPRKSVSTPGHSCAPLSDDGDQRGDSSKTSHPGARG